MNQPSQQILQGVSRSFYLSLRVLPASIRQPASLAYLLARAADTVADTEILEHGARLRTLQALQDFYVEPTPAKAHLADEIAQMLRTHPHEDERRLLAGLAQLFADYQNMPATHLAPARTVLRTLTQGMIEDLQGFDGKTLRAFATHAETQRYTYLVAGCVGEFWTDLLRLECLPDWPREVMVKTGVDFGKGLQMVNILRDLPKDLQGKRCYLSQEILDKYDLQVADLASIIASHDPSPMKFRHLYAEMISDARGLLAAGMRYTKAIPRRQVSLRLAVLWPLLIGLGTLRLLETWSMHPGLEKRVRVPRPEVYGIVTRTSFFAPFNRLLDRYYLAKGGILT